MSCSFYHIWIIVLSTTSLCSLDAKTIKSEQLTEQYSGESGSKCAQNGITKCDNCDSSANNCGKPNKLNETLSDKNLLNLRPLNISSGGSSLITDKLIAVKFDYNAYGIAENGVLFHITEPPKYGTLEIEIWHRSQWEFANAPQLPDNVFTLHDLRTNKVRYTHDGSRDYNDSVTFQLEFHSTLYQLPEFLHGMRYAFPFYIIIHEKIGGSPRFNGNISAAIELTRDTKKVITNEILSVDYDHKTSADQIRYKLINIVNSDQSFFASTKNPDSPITSFTQRDVDQKMIEFVHKTAKHLADNKTIKVLLKIFDQNLNNSGKSSNAGEKVITLKIKINEKPFSLSLTNHSTVQLIQSRNKTKILPKHLTTVSNDTTAMQANHIYYTIKEAPHHGIINVDDHHNISTFTQHDIDSNNVAYIQVRKAVSDYFVVDISASNDDETQSFESNVTVVIVTKPLVRYKKPYVNVSAGHRVVITTEYLDASELASITNSTPTFLVVSSPKYGYLKNMKQNKNRRNIINARRVSKRKSSLAEFTHEDIMQSRIVYIAEYSTDNDNEVLVDMVRYEISSPGVASALGKLVINILSDNNALSSVENHVTIENNRYNVTTNLIESRNDIIKTNIKNNNNGGAIDISPTINRKLGYLNIYITSDELLVALVFVLAIVTVIALIIMTRCCNLSKTQTNTQTIKCVSDSVDGSEMAMIANRASPTSIASPSVVSGIADSVRIDMDNMRTTSASPTSVTLTTNCSVSNVYTPHSLDCGDQPKLSSIYPLPPPSLYFTSGSASDIYPTGVKWPKCSLPTCKVTPIVPNCVENCNHYCTAIHRTLHHQFLASLSDRTSVPVMNKMHSCSANELYEAASRAGSPSIARHYVDGNATQHHCGQCDIHFNDSCVYPSFHHCIGSNSMIAHSFPTQTYPKQKQQFYI